MLLRDLGDVRDLFRTLKGSLLGVGITAYSRVIPAYFRDPYHIIALRKTQDLPLIRERAHVFCLEEELGYPVEGEGINSARLLSHPLVRGYLKNLPDPKYLLLYQNYPELEELAKKEGWVLLANPYALRAQVAERGFFRAAAERLQLNLIPGSIYSIEEIYRSEYGFWAKKIGSEFVIQLPDIWQGGGRGTFFIRDVEDYQRLQRRLGGGTWRGIKLKTVSILQFVRGTPASLALCLTGQGILFSGLQRQLVDLPYCANIPQDGIFCGHSWDEDPWPSHIHHEAIRQARLMGEVLLELGYRGILGIDFLISEEKEKVYALECNPRFTGAFPMLSQLHLGNGLIPMDVFHMLEFLEIPYGVDSLWWNSKSKRGVRGSHVLLFHLPGPMDLAKEMPAAGLYGLDRESGEVSYLGRGSDFSDIQDDTQFIVIDGPPERGDTLSMEKDPFCRLCRILFPCPIVDAGQSISSQATLVVDWLYQRMYK